MCDMCLGRFDRMRHIPLYVFGSEGITLCHDCEMELCKYVRDRAMDALRRKRDEHIAKRKDV